MNSNSFDEAVREKNEQIRHQEALKKNFKEFFKDYDPCEPFYQPKKKINWWWLGFGCVAFFIIGFVLTFIVWK